MKTDAHASQPTRRNCTGLAFAFLLLAAVAGIAAADVNDTIVERLKPHTDEIVSDLLGSQLDWVLVDARGVDLSPEGDMVFSYGSFSYDHLAHVAVDRSNACNTQENHGTVFTFTDGFEQTLSWTQTETLTAGASLTASAEYSSPFGYGGSVSATVYGEYSNTSESSTSTTDTTEFSQEKNWSTSPGFWTYAQWQIWDARYDDLPWQQDFYVEDVAQLAFEGPLSWESGSTGNLPRRSLILGESGDGAAYYACRASRGGGKFIGKVTRSGGCKFYDDGDKQVRGSFEVLVGNASDISWTSNTAAQSGVTGKTEKGDQIYLCKASFGDGDKVLGWARKGGSKCKVIKDTEAKERSDYKLALGNSQFTMLPFSGRVGTHLSNSERRLTDRGTFSGEVGMVAAFVACDLDCDEVSWGTTPTAEHCDLADSSTTSSMVRSADSSVDAGTPILKLDTTPSQSR